MHLNLGLWCALTLIKLQVLVEVRSQTFHVVNAAMQIIVLSQNLIL